MDYWFGSSALCFMHLVLGHSLNIFLAFFFFTGQVTGYPGRVTGQPVFVSSQKNRFRIRYFLSQVRSENSDPFCHVQKIGGGGVLSKPKGAIAPLPPFSPPIDNSVHGSSLLDSRDFLTQPALIGLRNLQ